MPFIPGIRIGTAAAVILAMGFLAFAFEWQRAKTPDKAPSALPPGTLSTLTPGPMPKPPPWLGAVKPDPTVAERRLASGAPHEPGSETVGLDIQSKGGRAR
jgi:hypothetical protein